MWHRHSLQLHCDEMFDGVNNRPALVGVLATKYEIASACSMPGTPKGAPFNIARAPHLGKNGFRFVGSRERTTQRAVAAPQYFSVLQANLCSQSAKTSRRTMQISQPLADGSSP